MARSWVMLEDGRYEVDGAIPELSPAVEKLFRTHVMARWTCAVLRESQRTGVPPEEGLAGIWRESHGDPSVIGNDPGGTHGYGLFQLTHKSVFKGHDPHDTIDDPSDPDDDVADPELNIALGMDLLATINKRLGPGQFPKAASVFNAGAGAGGQPHPSQVSPWGYRESKGHIDEEVRALNTAIRLLPEYVGGCGEETDTSGTDEDSPGPAMVLAGLVVIIGVATTIGSYLARKI